MAFSDSLWVVAQVRNRKARQAVSSLKQPMLQSAYSEPPVWTLPKLIRSAVITLVSGAIAGKPLREILPCTVPSAVATKLCKTKRTAGMSLDA